MIDANNIATSGCANALIFDMFSLEKITKFLLGSLLFLLPWQTIWIVQENFLNSTKWQYGTIGFYATEIILWTSAVFFILWFWQKKKNAGAAADFHLTRDRLFLSFCIIFVAYSLLSSIWATNQDIAIEASRHVMEAVILFIIMFVGPLNFKEAILSLSSGAVLQSFLGLYQFFTQSTFDFKWLGIVAHPAWEAGSSIVANAEIGRWVRAYGAFSHPNILGGYLAICLALLIFLSLKIHKITLIYWFKFTVLFAALFFTFSRSAWIAFGVFLFILFAGGFIVKNRRVMSMSVYFFIIITILSAIYWPIVNTRLFAASANEISSTVERISGLAEAWSLFQQHPILGVGAGNYTAAAYTLNPNLPGWEYQPVHNVFMLILTELGIVGVLILFCVITSYINSLRTAIMPRFYILLGMFTILAMFDHYLYSSYTGLIFFIICLGITGRPKHEEPHT